MNHAELRARIERYVAETNALVDLTNPRTDGGPEPRSPRPDGSAPDATAHLHQFFETARKSYATSDFQTYVDRLA
jgi:hypothetical protein